MALQKAFIIKHHVEWKGILYIC